MSTQSTLVRKEYIYQIQQSNFRVDLFWRHLMAWIQLIPILCFVASLYYMNVQKVVILTIEIRTNTIKLCHGFNIVAELLSMIFVLFNSYRHQLYTLFIAASTMQCTIAGHVVYVLITNSLSNSEKLHMWGYMISLTCSIILMTFLYFGERFSYRQRQGFRQLQDAAKGGHRSRANK